MTYSEAAPSIPCTNARSLSTSTAMGDRTNA